MPTIHFTTLKTERLLLRQLQSTDWKMISFLRTDSSVNQFVKRPPAETKEKAIAFIDKINEGIQKQKLLYWSICEKNNSNMLGTICLWNFSKDEKEAEVGYDLSPDAQGKGIMNEALNAVVQFGFDQLHLDLISAYTHKENIRSKRLLEKNNFKLIKGKTDINNVNNVVYELEKNVIV